MFNQVVLRVLQLPQFVKRTIVLFVDVVSCAVSTYLAFYLRLGEWVSPFNPDEWNVIFVIEVSILICLPIFTFSGLYRQIFRHTSWFVLIALLRAMGLYAILFIAIFTFYGFDRIPRTIGFIQPLILLFMAGSSRAFAGFWLSRPYQKQLKIASIPHVMIYGAGEAGRDLAAALSQSYEMRVMGFLDDDPLLIGRFYRVNEFTIHFIYRMWRHHSILRWCCWRYHQPIGLGETKLLNWYKVQDCQLGPYLALVTW